MSYTLAGYLYRGRHRTSRSVGSVGRRGMSLGAGALLAAGIAITGSGAAGAVTPEDQRAPAGRAAEDNGSSSSSEKKDGAEGDASGSTLSGPLNDAAVGSTDFTDFLAGLTRNIPGVVPGPYIGSTDGPSGSSGMLDHNLAPF
ncbi:hypothetical protein [Corynebacterium anserum]|uniref:Uncharacterized protein n=1 Tax=Corynebacterium anserum TaxID=2684406 RepID=A0A7G7YQI9_9CORY|nr:hypothetical protein [Corynebacterium anserum]MBC2682449.1 hypothetical protein [Corynebacterium anserum]QNH96759.1 hypothetical protein GP473_08965 [Corynebacterium anserum]